MRNLGYNGESNMQSFLPSDLSHKFSSWYIWYIDCNYIPVQRLWFKQSHGRCIKSSWNQTVEKNSVICYSTMEQLEWIILLDKDSICHLQSQEKVLELDSIQISIQLLEKELDTEKFFFSKNGFGIIPVCVIGERN